MKIFKTLFEARHSITTSRLAFDILFKEFDCERKQILDWNFDVASEREYAAKLARFNPDLIMLAQTILIHLFTNKRVFPKSYQTDLFKLKRCSSDALASVFPRMTCRSSEKKRIVIMVPWLPGNINNNIARVAIGYLSGLLMHSEVEDCVLLLTNENTVGDDLIVGGFRHNCSSSSAAHAEIAKEFGCSSEKIKYLSTPLSDVGSFNSHVKFCEEFQPNVVFVPNFEMTSAMIHSYNTMSKSIFLQTSIRNRPPYDYSRYLYLGSRRNIDQSHIHPELWEYHPFGYENFGDCQPVEKSHYGFSEDTFMLVSAGNRLELEINDEIMEVIRSVMVGNSNVVWLLLGVSNVELMSEKIKNYFGHYSDRVKLEGYVNNIGSVLATADMYINPRRTGGAVSMALAIYGNTPVLSFVGNDACNFVLEDLIATDAADYQYKLLSMLGDQAHYAKIRSAQTESFLSKHTIKASCNNLVDHAKDLLTNQIAA